MCRLLTILILSFMSLWVGCTGNALTAERVQTALNKWHPDTKVIGVREISSDNSAVADIVVSNVTVKNYGESARPYSGPAVANLKRYTNGKWIVAEVVVEFQPGGASYRFSLNLDV